MKIILFILIFSFALFAQSVCHGCFETKWRTQTATVVCTDAPAMIRDFQSGGFTQTQVSVRYETTGAKVQICDILAIKLLP